MRDSLYDSLVTRPALTIALRATGTVNGITVDKNYQNNQFRVVMFSVLTGTLTDGTITVTMQDSPDNSAWTAVDSSLVAGTLPVIAATSDDTVFEFGYNGAQRYVRLVFVTAAGATGGTFGAVAILGQPRRTPAIH